MLQPVGITVNVYIRTYSSELFQMMKPNASSNSGKMILNTIKATKSMIKKAVIGGPATFYKRLEIP